MRNYLVLFSLIILGNLISQTTNSSNKAKSNDVSQPKKESNDLIFIKIGKVEISKNYLKVDHFTNGDKLEFASTAEEFIAKSLDQIPVFCFYNFDSSFAYKGYYYNLFAIHDLKGRCLFTEDYRLPFNSELSYMNTFINVKESKKEYKKRLELKDYIFESNNDKVYNGFNEVSGKLDNNAFYNFKLDTYSREFGKNGYIDKIEELKHMFWVFSDFDIENDRLSPLDNLLSINYKKTNYSDFASKKIINPIEYNIAAIERKNKYNSEKEFKLLGMMNIESILPRKGHGEYYHVVAAQIKLVKQRPSITPIDWDKLCTSTTLKHIYEKGYGSDKITISNIKVAQNQDQWIEYCNNQIPACASFEFKTINDQSYGKLYNRFVFTKNYQLGDNLPNQLNSKPIDLIDFSNLRYSFNGTGEEFYNYLFEEHSLKYGGMCEIHSGKQKIQWYDNMTLPHEYKFKSFFGFVPVAFDQENFPAKSIFYLQLSNRIDRNNNYFFDMKFNKLDDRKDSYPEKFDGFSIRYLKNN
jgi:hypothetical protein